MDSILNFRAKIEDSVELYPLELSHALECYNLVLKNRDSHGKWLKWMLEMDSVEYEENFLKTCVQEAKEWKSCAMGIFWKQKMIGTCSLAAIQLPNETDKGYVDLGYWLDADYSGLGIVTKCCVVLLNYSFDVLKVNTARIFCRFDNAKSAAVAKRLKFTLSTTLENPSKNCQCFEDLKDLQMYTMIAKDWSDIKQEF